MGRVYCGPIYNLGREKVAKAKAEEEEEEGRKEEEFKVKKQNLTQGVRKKQKSQHKYENRLKKHLGIRFPNPNLTIRFQVGFF